MWIGSREKLKRKLANRLPVRPTVARASRGFICPICDVPLADGVTYEVCRALRTIIVDDGERKFDRLLCTQP